MLLLAPYANAWLILNRPTDADLPDDIVAMLVSLADYQTADWKPVAMWALVNSIRNLGSADAQVFSTPGNIWETKPRTRTTNASNYTTSTRGYTRRCSRRTRTRHRRRQPQPAKPTRPTHTRRKRHPRTSTKATPSNVIRGFLITDEDRRSALAHLRGELQTSPAMKKLLLIRANEQKAGYRITRPRSLKALPIMPEQVSAESDFAAWPESVRDHWANRIGNLVLSQANETQVAPLATYAQRRDRVLLGGRRASQTFSADGRARQYRRMHAADAAIPAG